MKGERGKRKGRKGERVKKKGEWGKRGKGERGKMFYVSFIAIGSLSLCTKS